MKMSSCKSVIQNTTVTPADITPKPLDGASFVPIRSKNDGGVVKKLVNYRYRYSAELMDKFMNQRLTLAEALLRFEAFSNSSFRQNLKHSDDSFDGENMNLPNTDSDSSKASQNKPVEVKDNSFSSEDANSIEEQGGVNPHLLALKLQALKEKTEANHDGGYSGSMSSENEEDHKKINVSEAAHVEGRESQKKMENVGQGNIQEVNENMEIMKSDTIEAAHYLLSIDYIKNLIKTLFSNTTYKSYIPSPDFTMENTRCTYPPSCEEVSGFGFNPNTDEGKIHIEINEEIVRQLTTVLMFGCQHEPHFFGSELHLEGEKMLLIAKTRWNVFLNHLQRVAEPAGETFAQIMLENFSCQINEQFPPNVKHYYICILEHKTTVYSTSIKEANEHGYINFGDRFIFENVTNTFDIKISLYSLRVKLPKHKCMKFCVVKRKSPYVAMVTLIGVAQIGLLNAKHRKFPFENLANVKGPEHQLLTTVEATLNWPKPVKGFLTMGFSQSDRQPIWHKRWCVLEAGQLIYFNFPSDELYSSPIGIVDVRKCASIENSPFKYMTRKIVMLAFQTNQNEFLKMFICADNNVDQMMWLETFNAIIKTKNDWRLFMT